MVSSTVSFPHMFYSNPDNKQILLQIYCYDLCVTFYERLKTGTFKVELYVTASPSYDSIQYTVVYSVVCKHTDTRVFSYVFPQYSLYKHTDTCVFSSLFDEVISGGFSLCH